MYESLNEIDSTIENSANQSSKPVATLLEFGTPRDASAYLNYDDGFPRKRSVLRLNSVQDIVWDNISLSWRQGACRSVAVGLVLVVMAVFWAMPIAWTAVLGQLDSLVRSQPSLAFIVRKPALRKFLQVIEGVLPGAALALLLYVLPIVLEYLSVLGGCRTLPHKAAFLQRSYFAFLFVQVIVVVSIASFFTASLHQYLQNLKSLQSSQRAVALVVDYLPSAANYFFSYMVLQGLGRSSGIVMQAHGLAWFVWDSIVIHTPAQKRDWRGTVDILAWACDLPVCTTLACVGLIYSIVAPLISVFVVLSFSLMWLSQRYSLSCVVVLGRDNGGVLYPRALHQTFVGVYVMLICLSGLFFDVRDAAGHRACVPHGVIMVSLFFAVLAYQLLLYQLFPATTLLECESNASIPSSASASASAPVSTAGSAPCASPSAAAQSVASFQEIIGLMGECRSSTLWVPEPANKDAAELYNSELQKVKEIDKVNLNHELDGWFAKMDEGGDTFIGLKRKIDAESNSASDPSAHCTPNSSSSSDGSEALSASRHSYAI